MSVFSLEDKYVLLQAENAKLKRQRSKLCDAISFWRWVALEAKAERDHLREQLQERQDNE